MSVRYTPRPLNRPTCPPHEWMRTVTYSRYGASKGWACLRCGGGDYTEPDGREAVKECVRDR